MTRREVETVSVTLQLRREALAKYRAVAGLQADTALAERMRMDHTAVWRVLNGRNAPSARFVAALVAAFSGLTIDDLWEVATDEPAAKAA
jgi:transcriptional regulator with XRE-family HTH domain